MTFQNGLNPKDQNVHNNPKKRIQKIINTQILYEGHLIINAYLEDENAKQNKRWLSAGLIKLFQITKAE